MPTALKGYIAAVASDASDFSIDPRFAHLGLRTVTVLRFLPAGGAERSTFQFCGTEHSKSAVAGLRLGGEFRHVVGVTQGCRPLGEPVRVTRSHENLILELDGKP